MRRTFFLAVLVGYASPSLAQVGTHEPVSVYHFSVPRDLGITFAAGAAVVVPYAFASAFITPRCPCDPREVNSFDRGAIGRSSKGTAVASDLTAGLALLMPVVLDYLDVGWSKSFREDAGVLAQTTAINAALVTFAKYVVQRPFPGTYAGEAGLVSSPRGYRAFYSGHTALAFAALGATAMTVTRRHGGSAWPWIVMVTVGGSVAAEMVASGRHFPTDVIAGAVAGTATGIVIPLLHYRN